MTLAELENWIVEIHAAEDDAYSLEEYDFLKDWWKLLSARLWLVRRLGFKYLRG